MDADHKAVTLLALEKVKLGSRRHECRLLVGLKFANLHYTRRLLEPNQLNLRFFQGGT